MPSLVPVPPRHPLCHTGFGHRGRLGLVGLLVVLAGLGVSACGGSSESDSVKQAKDDVASSLRSYFTAIIDSDGAKACGLLTRSQQRAIPRQTPADDDCQEFLTNYFPTTGRRFFAVGTERVFKNDIPELKIAVEVAGRHAIATPGDAKGKFGFTKQPGGWKISDLGLQARGAE